MKNKKGQISGTIIGLIMLLVIVIMGFIFGKFITIFNKSMDETEIFEEGSKAKEVHDKVSSQIPEFMDNLIFFAFIALMVGTVIAAVKSDYSWWAMGLYFIQLAFAVLVAFGAVELYSGLAIGFQDLVNSHFKLTNIVFSRYTPALIAGVCGILMFLMSGGSNRSQPF